MSSVNFVLIHGAWHGGWCWRHVAPLLRRAGHDVFAPSLTGMGDRAHLARPDIDLETHITDVVTLLEMHDLHDVVLLGHSYGGMVVTGAADRAAKRIRRLVYFDAFVPENGKPQMDYIAAAVPERAAGFRKQGEATGFIDPPPNSLWGHTDPKLVEWIKPREVRHPYRTMTQPLRLANEAALKAIPKTFVHCTAPATGAFEQFAAKYRNDPAWRFHELKSGHDAMILQPKAVADILLKETEA
jgi:pimeloyl-ACP methyl ester carboxylesterase